ncbi:MAG TPA: threonine-phosphate decarboxylase [Clostridia bacterium]|nr:threonine-phosphate decarboxylase [Clostridia bacterium]
MNFHGGDIYKYSGEILDFSSNINPFGVPDSFRRLLAERLGDFTRYPDISYREVREKIAGYIGIRDIEGIIPGNGAVELIYKLAASCGMKRVAGLRPTFSEYARAAEIAGLEYYDIPAFKEDYSAIAVEMLTKNIRPHSLVIICNPNNPTGTFIKTEAMGHLAEVLQAMDCRLVIDEAFIEFTDDYPDNSMVSKIGKLKNVTVIRAATKFFGMPGIRLGYAVTADMWTAGAVRELMEPWNLNTAAVIAACSVFDDRDYIERSRAWISSEREYLFKGLRSFDGLLVYPSAANFHLLQLTGGKMTASRLKGAMADLGVLIRTAEGFNGLNQFHFRLAVKDRRSNDKLLESLGEALKAY